jgi:hypothetical protein
LKNNKPGRELMANVQLKITPSFASILGIKSNDWYVIEKEIDETSTIKSLLTGFAQNNTGFRTMVFNPDTGKLSDQVIITLNGNLLQVPDVTQIKLNDGDNIIITPAYEGG